MDEDRTKIIKDQLLKRAVDSPYVATDVLGKDTPIIFKNDLKYITIARVLATYYRENSELISKDVLSIEVGKNVDRLIKTGRLEESEKLNYYNYLDELMDIQVDTSSKMSDKLNSYVKNALAEKVLMKEASKYVSDNDYDLSVSIRDHMEQIEGIDVTGVGSGVLDVMNDTQRDIEELKTLGAEKIPFGIKPFDEATQGGLARGEVGLIGASSGFGKSTMLSNMSAQYIRHGHNVLHITLEELSSRQILRFAQLMLGMEPKQLFMDGGKVKPDALEKIQAGFKYIAERETTVTCGKLFLYKSTPRTETVDSIRQIITSTEHKHGIKIDAVVLDYADLLNNKYTNDDVSQAGGKLFQDIRKLAQDTNVVLFTGTQLNRGAGIQEVRTMANIEGSFAKINTVEFAVTMNRNKAENDNGFTRLYIDKIRNRYGYDEDFLYFKYDKLTLRFTPETEQQRQEHLALLETSKESKNNDYRIQKDNEKKQETEERIASINAQFE